MTERASGRGLKVQAVLLILMLGASGGCVTAEALDEPPVLHLAPEGVPLSFYDTLSPYGDWLVIDGVGPCWRPALRAVGSDFVPYQTGGQWVYSEHGWVFASQHSWGWAPFHYGRWFYSDLWGWLWAPDAVWGPAWVDWRYGSGFVGWAPLPPPGLTVVVHSYREPWCFVHTRHFAGPEPGRHRLGPSEVEEAHRATAVVPPQNIAGAEVPVGPPRAAIAQETGLELRPAPLRRGPVMPAEALRPPRGVAGQTPLPAERTRELAPGPARAVEPALPRPAPEPAPPPREVRPLPRGLEPTPSPRGAEPRGLEPAPPSRRVEPAPAPAPALVPQRPTAPVLAPPQRSDAPLRPRAPEPERFARPPSAPPPVAAPPAAASPQPARRPPPPPDSRLDVRPRPFGRGAADAGR